MIPFRHPSGYCKTHGVAALSSINQCFLISRQVKIMFSRVLIAASLMLAVLPALLGAREMQPLVSVDWLERELGKADLAVVDVRSAIDGSDRSDFEQAHIPGSVYASYTEAGWREERNGVPGMLPPEQSLAELISGLGIDNDTDVVIVPAGVGSTDFGSAARVYWTFKVLGHDRVSILNGGFRAWTEAGKPTQGGWHEPEPRLFRPSLRPHLVADADDVGRAPDAGIQLVDNRPGEQYAGRDKHPAASGMGTIPGALNLEQQTLTRDGTAFMVETETVRQLMDQARVSPDRQTITFCNTGHWAAMGWFALSEIAGMEDVALYDGSVVEWSQDRNRPLEAGGLFNR